MKQIELKITDKFGADWGTKKVTYLQWLDGKLAQIGVEWGERSELLLQPTQVNEQGDKIWKNAHGNIMVHESSLHLLK